MTSTTECIYNNTNKTGTCLPTKYIKLIAEDLNVSPTIDAIKKETECDLDSCILNKTKLDDNQIKKIELETLKPYADSYDPNYWLNNTEVDSCMIQFHNRFPGFGFSFIHMIDLKMFSPTNNDALSYVVYPVTEIDYAEEFSNSRSNEDSHIHTYNDAKLKSYGVVFNTDSSKGSGQHWFVIYISTDQSSTINPSKKRISIELFNSSGQDINNEDFNRFWTQKALEINKKTGQECVYEKVSNIRHQRDDTGNCGAYSLYYIWSRLNGKSPSYFNNGSSKVEDEFITKFRSFLFRNDNPIY
jgi:hypothetical protein